MIIPKAFLYQFENIDNFVLSLVSLSSQEVAILSNIEMFELGTKSDKQTVNETKAYFLQCRIRLVGSVDILMSVRLVNMNI